MYTSCDGGEQNKTNKKPTCDYILDYSQWWLSCICERNVQSILVKTCIRRSIYARISNGKSVYPSQTWLRISTWDSCLCLYCLICNLARRRIPPEQTYILGKKRKTNQQISSFQVWSQAKKKKPPHLKQWHWRKKNDVAHITNSRKLPEEQQFYFRLMESSVAKQLTNEKTAKNKREWRKNVTIFGSTY